MAAENVGSIYYTVEARTEALIQGERDAAESLDNLQQNFNNTDTSANNLNTSLSKLAIIIQTVVAASVLRDIAAMVQGYQEMEDRIKLATRSTEEYNTAQERLLATANGTYRSLTEAQKLFVLTSDTIRSLGYTLNQTIDIQDSLSYAFVRNATSVDNADAAIKAFTVGLQKGKIEGDGWTTLISAIPSVVNDLAKSMNKSTTEVRNLGASGKLTGAELAEGLRKSLEANSKAAAEMTNNLRDAGVRMVTAFTQIFVSVENQSGVLQKLTDGLISTADNMLKFGTAADKITTVMDSATSVALALAAVYTGRLVTSVATYTTAQVSALAATLSRNNADRMSATINLTRAAVERDVAIAAVAVARAEMTAAQNTAAHAFAAQNLATARARATAATEAHMLAQQRLNAVATTGTVVLGGLRTVMAFLGGPTGLILLAAAALLTFSGNATITKNAVDNLNDSLDTLTFNQLQRSANQIQDSMADLNKELSAAMSNFNTLSKRPWEDDGEFKKRQENAKAVLDDVNKALEARKKRLEEIAAAQAKMAQAAVQKPDEATGKPAALDDPDAAKRIDSLKEEVALLKVAGVERAKLKEIQKLGDKATPSQIKEAEALAASIYQLEEAEKAKNAAVKEGIKDAKAEASETEKSLEAIKKRVEEARIEAATASMTKRETELYKLQLMGATQEQLKAADASLTVTETYDAQAKKIKELAAEEKRRKDSFGDTDRDARKKVLGTVTPLSGGEFDNQYARYEAEAKAENERYTDQLERFKQAQDLKIEVLGGYQALEEEMASTHADRLKQIEAAKNSMILTSGASFFESMAGMAKTFAGESSGIYKAMFVTAKAFAIADAGLKLSSAVAQAMADPAALSPAQKFANMAAVAAAGANVLSQITSVAFSGRANGGPVQAGQMYRVNEGGAPEVFNAANGQQFMLANQRGEVVSNKNAGGGGGGIINHIIIQIGSDGTASVSSGTSTSESKALAQGIRAVVVDELERQSRPNGVLWKMKEG